MTAKYILPHSRYIALLCLIFLFGYGIPGASSAYQFRCMIPVSTGNGNQAYIDCCRTIDLNNDQHMDVLVSCQLGGSGDLHYGELINMGTDFCLRQGSTNIGDICTGVRAC